jgi:hypothetical protein
MTCSTKKNLDSKNLQKGFFEWKGYEVRAYASFLQLSTSGFSSKEVSEEPPSNEEPFEEKGDPAKENPREKGC